VATANVTQNRKQTVYEHLTRFYKWKQIPFTTPKWRRTETLPWIPTEAKIGKPSDKINYLPNHPPLETHHHSYLQHWDGHVEGALGNLWKSLQTTKAKELGLPIVKRIIDAHGGEITAETKTGTGTTFTIRLSIKPKVVSKV
jgi:hypothetical protein